MSTPAHTSSKRDFVTSSLSPSHSGLLQRKSTWGGLPGLVGHCTECNEKRPSMDGLAPNESDVTNTPSIGEEAMRSPIDASFGHDFSRVQVHASAVKGNPQLESAQELSRKSHGSEEEEGSEFIESDQPQEILPENPPLEAEPPLIETEPEEAQPLGDGPKKAKGKPKKAKPTIKIVSETVATTPANRARRKIGIGEQVVCSTDPATSATWSVTGGGSVTPISGNSTTLTASKSPSTSTVKATVGTQDFTAVFDVIAPNGMTATVKSNPGSGTLGPPNNQIGFQTVFDCVVKPNTVAFHRIEFRENIPQDTWTWPDGTADSNGPKVVPWSVGEDNKTTDTVSSALRPIGRLNDGTKNVDFAYTIRVPEDYKDESGTWVTWLANEEHLKEYKGATQKGRGTLKATNNISGTWQGPWQ